MRQLEVKIYGGAVRFPVRLQPRSSKNEIGETRDGALRIWVNAAPVDGAANEALVALLSRELGIPKRDVTIVSGAASRNKTVEVTGVSPERIHDLAK